MLYSLRHMHISNMVACNHNIVLCAECIQIVLLLYAQRQGLAVHKQHPLFCQLLCQRIPDDVIVIRCNTVNLLHVRKRFLIKFERSPLNWVVVVYREIDMNRALFSMIQLQQSLIDQSSTIPEILLIPDNGKIDLRLQYPLIQAHLRNALILLLIKIDLISVTSQHH